MKRRILSLLVALISFAWICSAKSGDSEPVIWGMKANIGMLFPSNWRANGSSFKMYNHGVDFQVGGVANIYLGRGFYFEPGVSLFYDTYKYSDLSILGESGSFSINPAIHKFGVRVPLVFGYSIGLSDTYNMSVFTGPQIGYALWGDLTTKYPYGYNGDEFPTDLFGVHGQRRFDFGWRIGTGFPVHDNLVVSLEGEIGISNMLKHDISFRENRFTIGLTYYF
ncbi:MAG: PorT family protein [Muribaculaceae bacterium]|nr:PorT family protein [Muribaculaceae bacterium]